MKKRFFTLLFLVLIFAIAGGGAYLAMVDIPAPKQPQTIPIDHAHYIK